MCYVPNPRHVVLSKPKTASGGGRPERRGVREEPGDEAGEGGAVDLQHQAEQRSFQTPPPLR